MGVPPGVGLLSPGDYIKAVVCGNARIKSQLYVFLRSSLALLRGGSVKAFRWGGIMYTKLRWGASLFSALVVVILLAPGKADAQDKSSPPATPLERLQQCDRDLCNILRAPAGEGRP